MTRDARQDDARGDDARGDDARGDDKGLSDAPADGDDRSNFDWQSPRWRETGEDQAETERKHRYRDDAAPDEHGAIDRNDSVGRERNRPPAP